MESKKSMLNVLGLVLLLVGLAAGIVLVGREQILRTRADIDVTRAFEIKDAQGNNINCSNNVCDVETLDVTIQLKPEGLEVLGQ